MITESAIYWITRLDDIKTLCNVGAILFSSIGVILLFVSFIVWGEDEPKSAKNVFKIGFLAFILSLPFIAGHVLVPTSKEMCAIKIIPRVANNQQVQEMPNKIVDLANEWIEELKPKSKSGEQKND